MGAYNHTNSLAPRQPEKDLPRWPMAVDIQTLVRMVVHANIWMNVLFKHWHVKTLAPMSAADILMSIANEFVRVNRSRLSSRLNLLFQGV